MLSINLNFEKFKNKAIKILKLDLDGYKQKRVKRRTDSLMRRHNVSNYKQCLTLLKTDNEFKSAFIDHFTINTTEFFRNPDNFKYIKENILPSLFENQNQVNIWSAPCSDGSEPYTMAIILNELGIKSNRFHILASDLDPGSLEVAKKGVYESNSLKNVSDKIIKNYFERESKNTDKYKVKSQIINQVEFNKCNLIKDTFPSSKDLILCRNFIIYLTKEFKHKLINDLTSVLNSGGYLFLGNTEFIFHPTKYGLKKVYSSLYKKI